MRVLVVDDEPLNREVARAVLSAEGHEVESCDNGLEALRRCAEAPDAFDLVLMDLLMPLMDGFEAMRRLRADPHTRALPILCVSAKPSAQDVEAAMAAGCDHFLCKPYRRRMLLKAIDETLARHQGGGAT